jgi:hypothetical protein
MDRFVPLQTFVRHQALAMDDSVVDADFDAQEREACLAAAARELGEAAVTPDELFEFVVTEYADQLAAMTRGVADCDYSYLDTFFRYAFERIADRKAAEIRRTTA